MLGTEGGPHWAPYVTVSIENLNACNFLRNKYIWKRTSPLCSSSNSSPRTYITLPPSHLKCSTGIQYGNLQNGGRQGHPTWWLHSRPNKVKYGCYPFIPYALWFTMGGKELIPHPVLYNNTFVMISGWISLRMRNISNIVEKLKTHILYTIAIFRNNPFMRWCVKMW